MSVLSYYRYYFEEIADDRVSEWLFMSTPFSFVFIITAYIYIVKKAGPQYMASREPYDLKRVIQIYNILQIIMCSSLIYALIVNGWFTSMSPFKCHPIDYSNDRTALNLASITWWTFTLKLFELIETIFFVLRKKFNQISNLHLYHHTSTLIFGWVGVKYVAGGMATFVILINSFIHILMYGYYLLSTLGPEWQKRLLPYKPKLTILQMIQFTVILLHSSIALQESCKVPKILAYLFIPNVIMIYYLFYDFYKKSYSTKNKTK